MKSRILGFSAALLLMASGGAAADSNWAIDGNQLYFEAPGKPGLERSAYVQSAACGPEVFALKGGIQ